MRKINLLVAMLAITFCSVMAQNNSLTDKITISQTSLNVNKQDIDLNDEAVGYLTDPEGKMIALDCIDPKTAKKKHPKHVLKVYRLEDKKLMWSKDYKPSENKFQFLKNGIMEISYNSNITILNKKDGTKIWKKDINYIGMIGDTLIAASNSGINAFNVENCEKIWLCKMNTNYGVTYCRTIDNNWNYLVSNSLYRINLSTGDILKLKSKTGVEDPNSTTGFMYLGFPGGGFIGGFISGFFGSLANSMIQYKNSKHRFNVSTNEQQLFMMPLKMISGMHSNVVSKDGLNYYADYNSFMCFDDSLKLIYRTKANNIKISPKNYIIKESKSELIVKNDTAYVVSLGSGIYSTKGKKFYDFPHIASYNIKDGKALDRQRIAYDSVTIVSTNVNDTIIRMLLNNREESYRFADRFIHYTNNDTSKVGRFVSYLTDNICYVKNTDNSFSAIKSTEQYTPVLTTRGYIVDITEREPKIIAEKENTYFQVAQINNAYIYQGGKNENELWYFNSGQATLIADDVKQVLQNNDKLEILTTTGKARIISLGI